MNMIYAILSIISIAMLVIAPLLYIWSTTVERIRTLESKMETRPSQDEIRVYVNDKLEPVKSDLQEISQKIDKILDHLIDKK